jgi:hypothetical protein
MRNEGGSALFKVSATAKAPYRNVAVAPLLAVFPSIKPALSSMAPILQRVIDRRSSPIVRLARPSDESWHASLVAAMSGTDQCHGNFKPQHVASTAAGRACERRYVMALSGPRRTAWVPLSCH